MSTGNYFVPRFRRSDNREGAFRSKQSVVRGTHISSFPIERSGHRDDQDQLNQIKLKYLKIENGIETIIVTQKIIITFEKFYQRNNITILVDNQVYNQLI